MFRLWVNPDGPFAGRVSLGQVNDFLERWNFVEIIENNVPWTRRGNTFASAQSLHLSERKIVSPESCDIRSIRVAGAQTRSDLRMIENVGGCEFVRSADRHAIDGRCSKERFVTRDRYPVLCEDQVRLDIIGA